jgi:hypothetical protein
MDLIEYTYFGWQPLGHGPDCPNPVWDDAEVLHDQGVRPGTYGADHHDCSHADCSHRDTFDRVQLRLLCRDCGTVHTISGESLVHVLTHTSVTGWGQPPTQAGEVWLWPGRPPAEDAAPAQYLVTRQPQVVTEDTLYGIITSYFDADGTPRWIAGAVPDADGEHYVHSLRWRHRSAGLATLDEAAAWIATAERRPQRRLVVAV